MFEKKCANVSHSVVSDFATPWTVAHHAALSMGFSRQEYWSGCHSLCQGIFLTQESNPGLLHCKQILYHLGHQGSPILCIQEQIFIECILYIRCMKSTSECVQILILGSEEYRRLTEDKCRISVGQC